MRSSSVMAKRWMSFWTVRLLRNTVWIRHFSSLNFQLPHDIPVCVDVALRNNSAICIFKVLLIHRKELIEKCNNFIYLKETAHINQESELAKGYFPSTVPGRSREIIRQIQMKEERGEKRREEK